MSDDKLLALLDNLHLENGNNASVAFIKYLEAFKGKPKHLSEVQMNQLINAAKKHPTCGQRDELLIFLMFTHGLRSIEAAYLHKEQFDLINGYAYIVRAKNGTPARHPLRGKEITLLRNWLKQCGDSKYMFSNKYGVPISRRTIRHIWQMTGQKAGFNFPVRSHMGRHSCGYYLVKKGLTAFDVRDYLGHRNIDNTYVYIHSNEEAFKHIWSEFE